MFDLSAVDMGPGTFFAVRAPSVAPSHCMPPAALKWGQPKMSPDGLWGARCSRGQALCEQARAPGCPCSWLSTGRFPLLTPGGSPRSCDSGEVSQLSLHPQSQDPQAHWRRLHLARGVPRGHCPALRSLPPADARNPRANQLVPGLGASQVDAGSSSPSSPTLTTPLCPQRHPHLVLTEEYESPSLHPPSLLPFIPPSLPPSHHPSIHPYLCGYPSISK